MSSRLQLLLTIAALLLTGPASGLSVESTSDTLTITGVTAGGSIAWNAIVVDLDDGTVLRTGSRGIVGDEDGDGVVQIRPATAVTDSSVWGIVSLSTGEATVYSPRMSLLQAIPDGDLRSLQPMLNRAWITLLLARPGTGAWSLEITEGSGRDGDRMFDGRIRIDPSQLEPLQQGTASPDRLQPGDVLIAFDWETLDYAVVQWDGKGARQ